MTAGRVTFSSAVIPSSRLKNWNTMPMCRRRMIASSSSVLPTSDIPASSSSPSVGESRPATRLSNVDLPHPDGPIDRDELAGAHLEVDAAQRADGRALGLEVLPQTARAHDDVGGAR